MSSFGTSIVRISDGKVLDFELAHDEAEARALVESRRQVDPEGIYRWVVARVEVVDGE